ncbi:UDP-N-acetylglucosamine diphosphorylase/glucosamine-1-phosphate N-acetyltransferase [Reichenbachiella faecimaris]|uniref:UDP-N-acetylglucosamine diphosphorylase/glucosamine-1-phosphate N-acetyltransferase n=1 Tax=Reichenbachiella faecimaris TaxID=692418 RepID=A0A1W2GF53_REIFA|nr:GlmU family protein [Reichenbachiella faecimaris]SMD35122.1 UDP-N-acetylglucosamine diphosphorylase/glucosamine-1-phosphate N-acetyltransferase [Reichenbachiella faecimaris]
MNISLADLSQHRTKLFPFTLTRPVADLRVGILTIREKWEKHFNQSISFLAVPELQGKYPKPKGEIQLMINGIVCPDVDLVNTIKNLNENELLRKDGLFIAAKGSFDSLETNINLQGFMSIDYQSDCTAINRSWDLFANNKVQLQADFDLLTKGRTSQKISDPHTIVYGTNNVFLEEGVDIKAAILNAEEGPIYLAKNSIVQEGATIRGPFALGENSRINMNAKIREGVTIGPNCKIGGEVSNSIVYGNSNKAHDGYLGNAVVGEWCNLGADTNNSNLKNNYDEVNVYDFETNDFIKTGLQFCGLFMGDHSKTAINTALNTGTTIGVCSNVFGSGFPPTYIPSFSWGGQEKMVTHKIEKAIATARKVWARKNIEQTEADEKILKTIFDRSTKK